MLNVEEARIPKEKGLLVCLGRRALCILLWILKMARVPILDARRGPEELLHPFLRRSCCRPGESPVAVIGRLQNRKSSGLALCHGSAIRKKIVQKCGKLIHRKTAVIIGLGI